ncbi:MAG: hypothetical protein SCARUB_05114 [Candidatus Scalindua rubra]|uniref:FlgD/Vpr Ig-like domain-containing protein n=1 Tax=Candidatus Scalindua rubra TaxID=1872076 RepID=A0A1E3X484_9BACT|nr:MAG: hypothetical protein SCARUB_05114 [Candidatus Scalindua rubra]
MIQNLVFTQPQFQSHKIVKMEAFDFDYTDDYRIFIYVDSSFSDTAYYFYEKLNWYEYDAQNSEWKVFHVGIAWEHIYEIQYVNFISDIDISRQNSEDMLITHDYMWGPEGTGRDLWRNDFYLREAGLGAFGLSENIVKFDPTNDSTIYISAFEYNLPDYGFMRSLDNGETWDRIWDTLSFTSWVPEGNGNLKVSPFDNTNIILSGYISKEEPVYGEYSFISTTDYGETWYENPIDLFMVNDFEFISQDSVIFHTDNGRYISSDGGTNPSFYDSLISDVAHYDLIDNQFYFNVDQSLLVSNTKGLTYSVLIDSLDSRVNDIYGVKNSDTVYVCTEKSVYIYHYNTLDTIYQLVDSVLSVDSQGHYPENFVLNQNFPNPFNPYTTITYTLTKSGHVRLDVFDLLGNKVKTLTNKRQNPSSYSLKWDGTNDSGMKVSTGLYFYRLTTEDLVETKKMIFLR